MDGSALGLAGRVTSLLARPEGTVTFTVGAGPGRTGPATFTTVRLLATGAPDPTFGGTGVVSVLLGPGAGAGIGAAAVRRGPSTTTLVAGTDMNASGTPRGSVIRLRADGTLDTRFGNRGIVHMARSGRDIRITSMVRDSLGRILLAGTGRAPDSLIVRLRASGARDRSFGNGGLTYRRLGRPPGGDPIYTTFEGIDAAGSRAVLVGSSAGPGRLLRSGGGTILHRPLRAHRLEIAVTRSCSQGTCGSCSGFISTLRSTRTPSASISTPGCSAANAGASIRSVLR